MKVGQWDLNLYISIDFQSNSSKNLLMPRALYNAEGAWWDENDEKSNLNVMCIFKGIWRHLSGGKHYRNKSASCGIKSHHLHQLLLEGMWGFLHKALPRCLAPAEPPNAGVGASPPLHQACPHSWPAACRAWWWPQVPPGAILPACQQPEARKLCLHPRTSPHTFSVSAGGQFIENEWYKTNTLMNNTSRTLKDDFIVGGHFCSALTWAFTTLCAIFRMSSLMHLKIQLNSDFLSFSYPSPSHSLHILVSYSAVCEDSQNLKETDSKTFSRSSQLM